MVGSEFSVWGNSKRKPSRVNNSGNLPEIAVELANLGCSGLLAADPFVYRKPGTVTPSVIRSSFVREW
jgi:hypothetical protein